MMDIRAFETELEKLRSGFSFDTTKLCGMYVAALARAEAAEAAARRESNTAGELLAVIARIGETLGIAMSTPNLCRVVQAEVETVKARAEAAEAEALKQARCAAQARMRHANLLRRRGLEEPLTTVENEAEAAGLRARAEAIEAERDDLRDANGVLSEALEAAWQMLVKLSARVAELEAQLAAAGSRVIELEAAQDESYHAYLELKEEADSRGEPLREACRQNMILTARVAELEAQLAAQGWRAMNTPPEAPGEYEIGADYIPDVRRAEYHADTNTWYEQIWQLADWATRWRPLPAPAPDMEPTL